MAMAMAFVAVGLATVVFQVRVDYVRRRRVVVKNVCRVGVGVVVEVV